MEKKLLFILVTLVLTSSVSGIPSIQLGTSSGDVPFVQLGDTVSYDLDSGDFDNVCKQDNATFLRYNGLWGCGVLNMSSLMFTLININETHTYININESDPVWLNQSANYYNSSQTDTQIVNANTSMKSYVDSDYVPYSGATDNVDLGNNNLTVSGCTFFTTIGGMCSNGNTLVMAWNISDAIMDGDCLPC